MYRNTLDWYAPFYDVFDWEWDVHVFVVRSSSVCSGVTVTSCGVLCYVVVAWQAIDAYSYAIAH